MIMRLIGCLGLCLHVFRIETYSVIYMYIQYG